MPENKLTKEEILVVGKSSSRINKWNCDVYQGKKQLSVDNVMVITILNFLEL